MPLFFWFNPYLEARAELEQKFVGTWRNWRREKIYSEIYWPLVWCEHGGNLSMVVYWQTSFSALLQGFAFNFHGDPRSLDFPLSQLASTMFASFDSVWPHQSLGRRAPGTRWRPNRDRGQVRTRNWQTYSRDRQCFLRPKDFKSQIFPPICYK